MNQRCAYIIMPEVITAVIDNQTYNIYRSDYSQSKLESILQALKSDQAEKAKKLISREEAFKDFVQPISEEFSDPVAIANGVIYWKGKELHNALTRQIMDMMDNDHPVDPLLNFLRNLMQNPAHHAVEELYNWMNSAKMVSITPDGHFLAYKKVRENYTDIHSGKYDNNIGAKPEMPRNEVDDDRNRTCSKGLHFCSYDYLRSFGSSSSGRDRVVVVKINPRDVVTIPSDYNDQKGRCCLYEVVGEIENWQDNDYLSKKSVNNDYDQEDWEAEMEDLDNDLNDEVIIEYPEEIESDNENREFSYMNVRVMTYEILGDKTLDQLTEVYNNLGGNIKKFKCSKIAAMNKIALRLYGAYEHHPAPLDRIEINLTILKSQY